MSTEAMQLALDALDRVSRVDEDCDILAPSLSDAVEEAIAALRQAIAQPETKLDRFLSMVKVWVERDGGDMDAALAWMYSQPAQVPTITDALAAGDGCLHARIDELESQVAALTGEPVAWMTHHDTPMLFLTEAEAIEYCAYHEIPIPLFTQKGTNASP